MSNRSFTNATQNGPTKTQSDVWITPKWLMDALGEFDLDPCGWLPRNNTPIVRTAKNYFIESDDGLTQDWYGDVFVNFPYSDSKAWLEKCKNEYLKGRVNSIVVLCFVRSDTRAWQQNVRDSDAVLLINKRIKFLNYEGIEKSNGNAPSCLIAFGKDAVNKIKNIDGILLLTQK